MVTLRTYTIIYVVLIVLAISKVIFFQLFTYWPAVTATLAAAAVKSALIVGYYQHVKFEPRSITYLVSAALFAVLLLTIAAAYSIT